MVTAKSVGGVGVSGVVAGCLAIGVVTGAATLFLDAAGLVGLWAAWLLCGVGVWALGLQRTEMLWVLFAASFVLLPFNEVRVTVGTLWVPVPAFVGGFAIGIICLRLLVSRDFRVEDHGIWISLGALLFGSMLSLMMARAPDLGAWLLLKWLFHSVLLVFLMSFRDRVWWVRTLLTLILVTGGLSAYGLFEYAQTHAYDVNFYTGVGTRTATGQHLALVLPLALGLGIARELSSLARLSIWTSIGVSLVALAFSFSRSAWLAVLMGLCVLGFSKRRVLVLSMLGLSIIVLGYMGPQEVVDRFWTMFSVEEDIRHSDISNAQRLDLQWRGLKMILDHPILGVGLGNFALNVPQTIAYAYANPHDFYLTTWAEGGVLAFLGLIGVLFFVIKRVVQGLRKASSPLGENLLRGALGSLASLITLMCFLDDLNHILTWTILGLSVSAAHLWGVKPSEATDSKRSQASNSPVRLEAAGEAGKALLAA